jgi:Dullard-like phosphatase family protein
MVLSENSVWGNRPMEIAIKLKLPERTSDKLASKKENKRFLLPSGIVQSPPQTPYGLVSPSTRKTKISQLAIVFDQNTSKPGSLLNEPPAPSKMSPIRLKLKNQTTKSRETLKENESFSPFVDPHRLAEIDFSLTLAVSQLLDSLSLSLVGGTDPSPILKKYTELVQDKKYSCFEAIFCHGDLPRHSQSPPKLDPVAPTEGSLAFTSDIRLAMRLEALTVMHVFFALVEQTVDCRARLADIIELCCASSHFFLLAVESGLHLHSLDSQAVAVRTHLRTHQTYPPRATLSTIAKKIRRNNASIFSKLNLLGQEASFSKISPHVSLLMPTLLQLPFERAIESIFECFFETLKQRGAMSVLYNEESKDQTERPVEPNFILQPAPTSSYLPPKIKDAPLTLVLDLDETLVHYAQISNETGEFYIRPFSQEFLMELSPYFEIVIFTAAVKCYADWILDRLDVHHCISHRLYRCSTKQQKGVFIKDLSRIGRELSRTIIVDNNPDNFQYQAENGIFIKSWYDDPQDTALEELARLLKLVARRSGEDVRMILADIRRRIGSKTFKALLEEV